MRKKLLSNKLDLAKLVMNEYRKNLQFKNYIERALFNVYDANKITDLATRRRIIDTNLLYCLKRHFQINIGTKSGGRALELIMESILKSKLQKSNNFDYEFVDWKEVDYFIIDKKINDWVMGIQCKMALHTTRGYLNYQQVLKKLEAFAKGFGTEKTLVMMCGVAVGYRGQDYTQQKNR